MKHKIIYLAVPYTWNPDKAFEIANKMAAKLMKEGHIVFSPISHSHPVADYLDSSLRTSQKFWMYQDLPILERCDELWVIEMGENGQKLISNSKGCISEIKKAKDLRKPVRYIRYNE